LAPTDPGPNPAEGPAALKEALLASLAVLGVLGAIKHVAAVVPLFAEHGFTIAAAFQLYVPLYLYNRRGIDREHLGLTFRHWRADLAVVLIWAAIVTVPFAIGHHYWQVVLYHRSFHFRLPPGILESILVQVLVVGLSEELYFRGYLQSLWERALPARRRLLGVPFGAAIVIASTVFALAHFVGEYHPARLGPFFSGLVVRLDADPATTRWSARSSFTPTATCSVICSLPVTDRRARPHKTPGPGQGSPGAPRSPGPTR
jgi:membrane protease YdiL (CAAX protease family)